MKKIALISICLLFLGASIAAAFPGLPQQTIQKMPLTTTGSFTGSIGYKQKGQNATIVGTISGTYELRNRSGRFTGDWTAKSYIGTVKGGFAKNILIGKVSAMVNGTEKSLPIVGFIKSQNGQFIGRFIAPVGPVLDFWGTYT